MMENLGCMSHQSLRPVSREERNSFGSGLVFQLVSLGREFGNAKKRNARRNNAVGRVKFAGEFSDAAASKEGLRDTAVIACSFANFETKGDWRREGSRARLGEQNGRCWPRA